MIRKDRRSDIKLAIPFLDENGIPEIPLYSIKIEVYTSDVNKKVARVRYNPSTNSRTFENCFFKDVLYTGITAPKPILILPLNSPNFIPGKLKCSVYVDIPDNEFSDDIQVTVKELNTNIVII